MLHLQPLSACSCHEVAKAKTELSIERELIWIRGVYRYEDRAALDEAVAEFRAHLEGDLAEPLSLRCWVSGATTLTMDLTVPMFSDHSFAPIWCSVLARTATYSRCEVRSRTL